MRNLRNEKGFTEFLTMIVMAVIAFLGLAMIGQFNDEKINEAVENHYNEYEIELIEKSDEEDNWDRKVILANGEIKYVNVECYEEDSKCKVKEASFASNS